jgi:uncharacterized protein
MLTDPLPNTLDVRKAAARGVSVKGVLKPPDLQHFRSLLAADEGQIRVEFDFTRDEENRHLIHLVVDAEVEVTCQRCLEQMPRQLMCENTLAVVWTDEQAGNLPRQLDPLVVEEQSCQLWDVVEEELILALPQFSYHETEACKKRLEDFNTPLDEKVAEEKPNPFNVLAQLKVSEDKQE